MVGMMNVNVGSIMICSVQVILDRFKRIEMNEKFMNIISKIIKMLSFKLDVNPTQIKQSLILAPLYPLFIYYFLSASAVAISLIIEFRSFDLETFGMFLMFIPFVVGAILFYFIFCYIFIYLMQLFLLKYYYINFWSILFCTLLHTIILIYLGFIILNLLLDDTWTLCIFSIPTAISYWLLLFRERHKCHIDHTQKFID